MEAVIVRRFGRIEEDLGASGIIDSISAMELLVLLQDEFAVQLSEVTVADLATVPGIVRVIESAVGRR